MADDPRKKPVGKLPVDAQRLLRNYYIMRPEIDLPPHLHELEGTWGRYFGDGRPEREVAAGFQPAFVLFISPLYPGEQPKWVTKKGNRSEGELVDPGLHDQPPLTEKGFVVGPSCNTINDQCVYIAWRSDGRERAAKEEPEAQAAPPDESPRDARRREQMEKKKRDLEERRKRASSRRR